jgi:hypothetical protein
MNLPPDFPFFRIGDVVQHKESRRVGEVVRFEHPTTDIWLCTPGTRVCGHGESETGPYSQMDFVKLEKKS